MSTPNGYRAQIAAAVRAQLLGKTVAGQQVMTSLDRRLDPAKDLPAVLVYAQTARRGKEDFGRSLIPRVVTITIECAVLADPGRELEAAEAFAEQIENAMDADRTLGQTVNECLWQQSISDVTSHGARTMGVSMLQYEAEIFTNQKPSDFFDGDGPEHTPHLVNSVPDVVMPDDPEPPRLCGELACGPDGCNIPDWQGELPA